MVEVQKNPRSIVGKWILIFYVFDARVSLVQNLHLFKICTADVAANPIHMIIFFPEGTRTQSAVLSTLWYSNIVVTMIQYIHNLRYVINQTGWKTWGVHVRWTYVSQHD